MFVSFPLSEECSAGEYKNSTMTECTGCEMNTISAAGAESCTACGVGHKANTDKSQCGKMNSTL